MSLESTFHDTLAQPEGFRQLDENYASYFARFPEAAADLAHFQKDEIYGARILKTPSDVLDAGRVLTNPSQVELIRTTVDGVPGIYPYAYFRDEPTTLHLSHTMSVPKLILFDAAGEPYIREFPEAQSVPGEDPRIVRNVTIKGPLGRYHTGTLLCTVVAKAKLGNPADVEGIENVFSFSEDGLANFQTIHTVKGFKNNCPSPVNAYENDTRLDVFCRPHPNIAYFRGNDITDITEERIQSAQVLTEGLYPEGIHGGPNTVKRKRNAPDLLELDIHEACAPVTAEGKILHYRLGEYGVRLYGNENNPMALLIPLGVLAVRSQFPWCDPKPPENGVASYGDVVYGSRGERPFMLTGVDDRRIGFAWVRAVLG